MVALTIALVVALAVGIAGWVAWHNARDDEAALRRAASTANTNNLGDSTTTTTSPSSNDDPFAALGDLGKLFGDSAAYAQCFASDIGSLLGNDRLQIPTTSAQAQYDALVEWVQRDRHLKFKTVPKPVYVDQAEMARRVRAQILRDYTAKDAQRDEALLVTLGVLAPNVDLRDEYAQFVGGQVAGYYDPKTGEMVILGNADQPLDETELTTLAHELEHALADQALGIPKAAEASNAQGSDAQLAATALVEGDATFTMTDFQLQSLGANGLPDLTSPDLGGQLQALEQAPHFLSAELLFPYTEGLRFVCDLKSNGGWDAVDRAYKRPPRTTAQVMFPSRYTSNERAARPPAPDQPGPQWRRVRTETIGAADLMFLFEAPGGDTDRALSDARGRAGAWAGGTLTQWQDGDKHAVTMSLVPRAGTSGPGLCDSMRAWLAATPQPSSGSSARAVQCTNANVQVSIATG